MCVFSGGGTLWCGLCGFDWSASSQRSVAALTAAMVCQHSLYARQDTRLDQQIGDLPFLSDLWHFFEEHFDNWFMKWEDLQMQ